MTGVEEYDDVFKEKINNLLDENYDIDSLPGFYYYLSNKSYTTIFGYLNNVVAFMRYTGNKDPERLTLDDYTKYMFYLKDKTSSYQIMVYSALKKFSIYLKASEKNANDPMQYIERPRAIDSEKTKQKRENGYLTTSEIKEYLNAVESSEGPSKAITTRRKAWKERDVLIILMLLNTGMRASALSKLDLNSVDLENMVITTNDKEKKVNKYTISEELVPYINAWLTKRKEKLGGKQEDAFFITFKLERISPMSISKIVNKYAVNIKGKHITAHKLRATYGTQLYDKTHNLMLVQEAMHHNNPKTTELYIRGNKEKYRDEASNVMADITMKKD